MLARSANTRASEETTNQKKNMRIEDVTFDYNTVAVQGGGVATVTYYNEQEYGALSTLDDEGGGRRKRYHVDGSLIWLITCSDIRLIASNLEAALHFLINDK